MTYRLTLLAAALLTASPVHAAASDDIPTGLAPPMHAETPPDDTPSATAPAASEPVRVTTDPRAPRQPLPAHDGADYLKTVPGFAVTRKGGTDGDASFRGMAGSRLGIVVDGEQILGGCNYRMDAPTAYIYPELYDTLTVTKGAQSVQHGAGHSAATVIFSRNTPHDTQPTAELHASLTGGSADRQDALVDARLGAAAGYVQLQGSHAQADDYEDGDGHAVHGQYRRYSLNGTLGWTPDTDTRLEAGIGRSDGEAAYADRGMDGTKFLRESRRLRLEKRNLGTQVAKIEVQAYDADVDHIMDDRTLRTPGMMGYANLQRRTRGGKLAGTFDLDDSTALTAGADAQDNDHRSRSAPPSGVYLPWQDDAWFTQRGLFLEVEHAAGPHDRLVAGVRGDAHEATDQRTMIMVMTMGGMVPVANPTQGDVRADTLTSGFARWEHRLADGAATGYVGASHSERFPDYWELVAKRGVASDSAFDSAQPERTAQLDAGLLWQQGPVDASLSLFYAAIDDYLLIDYTLPSMDKAMTGVTRNIDATTYGAEAAWARTLGARWKIDTSLAWVRGRNGTDGVALSQLAPPEARVGLAWHRTAWTAGVLLRAVAPQERYDTGTGNIVGKDLGRTPGYAVLSLNAGWKPGDRLQLSAGIDNLADRTYAEAISRGGAAIPGYVTTTRVNEPGRTLWLKLAVDF